MKIIKLETFLLRTALPKDWKFPTASFVTGGSVFLKIITDDGIVGWGEPSPYGASPEATIEILHSGAKELISGKTPLEALSLTRQNEARGEHIYGQAAFTSAMAGISQALWDILGKAENKPTYQILNPKRRFKTSVRAYASGGMIYEDSPRSWLIEEALEAKAAGYTSWKFRPTTPRVAGSHFQRTLSPPAVDIQDLIHVAGELRKEVGPEFELMLDAGCRLSVEEAIQVGVSLDQLNFSFFEEPVKRETNLYKRLIASIKTPIAIGECFFSESKFKEWIDSDALAILQPDANFAGMNEILAIAALARAASKPMILHNWASAISIAANVHLAAALPECAMLEYNLTFNPLRTELVHEPFVPKNGFFVMTDMPGLGIEIDEKALEHYSI